MGFSRIVLSILGLALLMVVHEAGHYFAARRYGMRVTKFSIGFGPTLWKHTPKGSPTTFQVAIIPMLAYVKIAGMNPYEPNDPADKGSYANASLWGRIVTIAAGPIANYFFASILFFMGLLVAGMPDSDKSSMRINVDPKGAAAASGMENGDKILSVNGEKVATWKELAESIGKHADATIDVEIERGGVVSHKTPHVAPAGGENGGKILIGPARVHVKLSALQAAKEALIEPPLVVAATVKGLTDVVLGKEKPKFESAVGIVQDLAGVFKESIGDGCAMLGGISAYLAAFNLLPFPALDGGRLIFLGFEAASRRKPNAKMEAQVHVVGLLMMLTLFVVISYGEIAALLRKP